MGRGGLPSFFLFLLLFLWVGVCHGRPVSDWVGRQLEVPEVPLKVVSLAPSITEIIFYLGHGGQLAAVTKHCDYPPEARKIKKIGTYVQPDLEKIVALRPDLCIGIRDGNPRQVVDRLAALGIPVYIIDPYSLADVLRSIIDIGVLFGDKQKAAKLVDGLRMRVELVRDRVGKNKDRPSIFFQIDAAPLVSVGSNTFLDELIRLAGGTNAAAGEVKYPRFNWEDVMVMKPEIVVITSMDKSTGHDALVAPWLRWPHLPAVRKGRLHVVDADMFGRPTARMVDCLEILAGIIHPELKTQGVDEGAK